MTTTAMLVPLGHATTARSAAIFDELQRTIFARTDRLFGWLFVLQWLAGIGTALWIAPRRWDSTTSAEHLHVWVAILLGGAISLMPLALVRTRPGRTSTRHVVAIAQASTSALLIHLSGGRLETHFHVFGSLALLAFYRDWRVLVSFSAVVAADHVARGLLWPQSVYGVLQAPVWRSLEHAGWIVFANVFLISACMQRVAEMRAMAERQAHLESLHEHVEHEVLIRTAELAASEARFRALGTALPVAIFETDENGQVTYVNQRWSELAGRPTDDALGSGWVRAFHPDDVANAREAMLLAIRDRQLDIHTARMVTPAGDVRWVQARLRPMPGSDDRRFIGTIEDVTERHLLATELQQAQKLEAIGRLAAGIAHEINTPIQFVGDNLHFLEESFTALRALVGHYQHAVAEAPTDGIASAARAALASAVEAADLEYLTEEVPRALTQSLEGVSRVSSIVQAMKDFAHHGGNEMTSADINRALLGTITVARNELSTSPTSAPSSPTCHPSPATSAS